MPVSKKIAEEMKRGSWIRRMFEEGIKLKQKYGAENIFDLSLGNPEIEPPEEFLRVLKEVINKPFAGMHRYMPNSGYPEVRAAIADKVNKNSEVKLSYQDIIMSGGAAGGLNVALKSTLDANKEIVILAPYFVEYGFYAENHSLKCIVAETDENFMPDMAEIEKKIGPNTGALLINSPNNPTGAVYDEKVISKIAGLLNSKSKKFRNDILLILDDAYHKLTYDGAQTPCIFNYYDNSIIVASFSKTLSIPGERIGFVAVNPRCTEHNDIMEALAFCNRTLGFLNAPAIMQHVIKKTASTSVDPKIYQKKRDFLYSALLDTGYETTKPQGAFYIFPKTPIKDDIAFVQKLVKERVLAVPGSGFGRTGFMRLSYCVNDRVLEGAVKGLKKALES